MVGKGVLTCHADDVIAQWSIRILTWNDVEIKRNVMSFIVLHEQENQTGICSKKKSK